MLGNRVNSSSASAQYIAGPFLEVSKNDDVVDYFIDQEDQGQSSLHRFLNSAKKAESNLCWIHIADGDYHFHTKKEVRPQEELTFTYLNIHKK